MLGKVFSVAGLWFSLLGIFRWHSLLAYSVSIKKSVATKREDGDEIGGRRVNFPLHVDETPTHSTEEQSEQLKEAQCL